MDLIIIPRDLFTRMLAHCRSSYPDEACGLLAGKGNVAGQMYRMTNAEKSPVSYLMDPAEQFRAMKQMRKDGHEIVAIYHSHPVSPAYPSAKDIQLASYPDSAYVIASLIDQDNPVVKAFRIVDGNVQEIGIGPGIIDDASEDGLS